MSEINDGGPAFPCTASDLNNPAPGMSLRAYFAGQALAALVSEMVVKMAKLSIDEAEAFEDGDAERTGFDDRCALFDYGSPTDSTYADVVAQEAVILADALIAKLAEVKE